MKMRKSAKKCVYCHLWDVAGLRRPWIPFPWNSQVTRYKAMGECSGTISTGIALSPYLQIPLENHLFKVSRNISSYCCFRE